MPETELGPAKTDQTKLDQTKTDKPQRLDKWLCYARVVKTRTLAQKLVKNGNVRLDSQRVTTPGHRVSLGMVLTITTPRALRILKILDLGSRRGPASEAILLYQDLSPKEPEKPGGGNNKLPFLVSGREPGAGRPTKKQRRQTDQLLGK